MLMSEGASGHLLRLEPEVASAVRRHGEETYPHECCGALIGRGDCTTAVVALPNTTEEGPRRRFLVRPSDYRMAEQRAGDLGGELLGFCGAATDMTVWYLKDDRTTFEKGDLHGDENPDSDTASTVHR
jgi:proteasome lid subunit RPN8/RPN11